MMWSPKDKAFQLALQINEVNFPVWTVWNGKQAVGINCDSYLKLNDLACQRTMWIETK